MVRRVLILDEDEALLLAAWFQVAIPEVFARYGFDVVLAG